MKPSRRIVRRIGCLLPALLCAGVLAACKPAGPPPDLARQQREALEQARNVEQQVQQHENERRQTMEEATK